MQQARQEPSLGQLFGELTREMSTLVRQEVALATTEVGQNASRVGREVAFLALGSLVAYAGLLALIAAVISLLAEVMPWWLSALVVGLVIAGIGYLLVQKAIQALKQTSLAPRATLETLKEDVNWAKEQVR